MKIWPFNPLHDVDQCRLACRKPAEIVQREISDLNSSIFFIKIKLKFVVFFSSLPHYRQTLFSAEKRPPIFSKKCVYKKDLDQ